MSFFKTLSVLTFTFISIFSVVTTAAGSSMYFFEPSVGYRSHTLRLTNYANSETKIAMASPEYGARLGLRSLMGIDFNLAYQYTAGKAEYYPAAEKNNFSQKTAAVQLGINALGLMKMYLGYGFMNELQIEQGLLNSDLKLKGASYQAGLQFKLIPFVELGLQYNVNQFKNIEGKNYLASDAVETYYNKVDSQDYSASLSIVF